MPTQTIVSAFLVVLCIGYSRGQWGLENLGDEINAQVQQSLVPLHNLGPRIREEVQRQLAPLNNANFLGQHNNRHGNTDNIFGPNWNPLGSDWSSNFASNLNSQLAPLQNLGDKINAQVQDGLKPVRILESTLKVKFGTDGTSVATYSPGGRRLIIKESILYTCDGTLSDADGTCSVPLQKLRFTTKKDFCYAITKTLVNNVYCLGSNGPISSSFINGEFHCDSIDGSPILIINNTDYRKLCNNVATFVKYKYYTHFPLKDFGNGLDCSGTNPQICTYSEHTAHSGSQIITRNSVVINST